MTELAVEITGVTKIFGETTLHEVTALDNVSEKGCYHNV